MTVRLARALQPLTPDQHKEMAEILTRVEVDLKSLMGIVKRAPFTDETMYVLAMVQNRLAYPLRQAAYDCHGPADAYPNTSYPPGPRRRI